MKKFIFLFLFLFSSSAFAVALNCVTGSIGGVDRTTCLNSDKSTFTKYSDGTSALIPDGCVFDSTGRMSCGLSSGYSGGCVTTGTKTICDGDKVAPDGTVTKSTGSGNSSGVSGFDAVVSSIQSEITTISGLGTFIGDKITYSVDYFSAFLPKVITKTVTTALINVWDWITTALATLVDKLYSFIKLPSLFSALALLNGGFGYFLGLIGFNYVLMAVIGGYLARFGIRRLPVVG